ncbi:MAG: hypothetical protein SFU56_04030 [Capsulimonadales bacterium]|nr:hypothetical protein [Capsulimonadales bacterium]
MSEEYDDEAFEGEPFSETEAADEDAFAPRLADVLNYRKITIAVVASYVGLEDGFITAVLNDAMDEYLTAIAPERETMKTERYADYLNLLGREIIVRYAATAAETLAAHPESRMAQARRVMGDTGGLGLTDDVNAVVRVHEIFEFLESPDENAEAEKLLLMTKRALCHYYNACAFDLVKGPLLPVIIRAAEEWYRQGALTAARVRDLIIAAESASA